MAVFDLARTKKHLLLEGDAKSPARSPVERGNVASDRLRFGQISPTSTGSQTKAFSWTFIRDLQKQVDCELRESPVLKDVLLSPTPTPSNFSFSPGPRASSPVWGFDFPGDIGQAAAAEERVPRFARKWEGRDECDRRWETTDIRACPGRGCFQKVCTTCEASAASSQTSDASSEESSETEDYPACGERLRKEAHKRIGCDATTRVRSYINTAGSKGVFKSSLLEGDRWLSFDEFHRLLRKQCLVKVKDITDDNISELFEILSDSLMGLVAMFTILDFALPTKEYVEIRQAAKMHRSEENVQAKLLRARLRKKNVLGSVRQQPHATKLLKKLDHHAVAVERLEQRLTELQKRPRSGTLLTNMVGNVNTQRRIAAARESRPSVRSSCQELVRSPWDKVQNAALERALCLCRCLKSTFGSLEEAFSQLDVSKEKSLSYDKFKHGLNDLGVPWMEAVGSDDFRSIFQALDTLGAGRITLGQLLTAEDLHEPEEDALSRPELDDADCGRSSVKSATPARKMSTLNKSLAQSEKDLHRGATRTCRSPDEKSDNLRVWRKSLVHAREKSVRIEEARNEMLAREMQECTAQPQISEKSKALASRKSKSAKALPLKSSIMEESPCTFKPELSAKSRFIDRRLKGDKKKFHERLYIPPTKVAPVRKNVERWMQERTDEMPFQPQISQMGSDVQNYEAFHIRLHRAEDAELSRSEKLLWDKVQPRRAQSPVSFTPSSAKFRRDDESTCASPSSRRGRSSPASTWSRQSAISPGASRVSSPTASSPGKASRSCSTATPGENRVSWFPMDDFVEVSEDPEDSTEP